MFLDITFVSAAYKSPIKYLITVNKQDDIQKIKSELVSLIDDKKCCPDKIVVAEVFNKHISKILVSTHHSFKLFFLTNIGFIFSRAMII